MQQQNTTDAVQLIQSHGQNHNDTNQQHFYFECIKNKWNTNQEVGDFLIAAHQDPNSPCISTHIYPRPESGTQWIVPKSDGTWYKNDQFIWRKRKEGSKLNREDHMKLKFQKQPVLIAHYVHSQIVPTFHRRVYSLEQCPQFVLIHYLNTMPRDKTINEIAKTIVESIISKNVQITTEELEQQLRPIYANCLTADEIDLLISTSIDLLLSIGSPSTSTSNIPSETTRKTHLERRNSCSSAFRRGLSSLALRRQPSANSEIDANSMNTIMKKYGCNTSPVDKSMSSRSPSTTKSIIRANTTALESRSPSGEAEERSPGIVDDDINQPQLSVKSTNLTLPLLNMDITKTSPQSSNGAVQSPGPSTNLIPIVEISPNKSSMAGGQKILIIGGWYMKGHEYKISFGNGRLINATLIQAGVLSAVIPSNPTPETINIQVFCNGQPVSNRIEFTFEDVPDEYCNIKEERIQQLFERIRILAYSLNAYNVFQNIPSFVCNESSLQYIVQQIDNELSSNTSSPIHSSLLSGCPQMPSRTVLHLSAILDFDKLFDSLMKLSRKLPSCQELNIMARDFDGCTPLHVAAIYSSVRICRLIVGMNPSTLDVLDDRGRTPSEVTKDINTMNALMMDKNGMVDTAMEEDNNCVDATEIWVMTDGKRVTKLSQALINEKKERMKEMGSSSSMISEMIEIRGGVQLSGIDCDSSSDEHEYMANKSSIPQANVQISMDTDVHVPDSPKMARLFQVLTSPGGIVPDNARAKMAELARQIIDALPDKIKRPSDISSLLDDDDSYMSTPFATATPYNTMLSQLSQSISMDTSSIHDEFYDMMSDTNQRTYPLNPLREPRSMESIDTNRSARLFASYEDRSFASISTRTNTFESDILEFDKDLGEFFTILDDHNIDPLQQRLAKIKFNDDEQRDVYEAAMVIQRAYREYRARNTSRQEDIERKAALKIQSCYRRYKQFCYFKKLHNAAIVVQKHFRMRKRDDKEEGGASADINDTVPEHPIVDGESIKIEVPKNKSLLIQHRAAVTIQHAYRGHRKRQNAARKIQHFMRQSRNKLRKMHAQNDDAILCVQQARNQLNPDIKNQFRKQEMQSLQSIQMDVICNQMIQSNTSTPSTHNNLDHVIIDGTNN